MTLFKKYLCVSISTSSQAAHLIYMVVLFLYLLAGLTSLESSSIDNVVSLCKTLEFPSDQLLRNISRVLKIGGAVLFYLGSQTAGEKMVIC